MVQKMSRDSSQVKKGIDKTVTTGRLKTVSVHEIDERKSNDDIRNLIIQPIQAREHIVETAQ